MAFLVCSCRNCGANLVYQDAKGLFYCEYCRSYFMMQADKGLSASLREPAAPETLPGRQDEPSLLLERSDTPLPVVIETAAAALPESIPEAGPWERLGGVETAVKVVEPELPPQPFLRDEPLPAELEIFSCQTCAVSFAVVGSVASTCPYCGAELVFSRTQESEREDFSFIPFSIDEDAARASIKKWLESKLVSIGDIQTLEMVRMYVPYWVAAGRCTTSTIASERKKICFEGLVLDAGEQPHGDVFEEIFPYDFSSPAPLAQLREADAFLHLKKRESDELDPYLKERVESLVGNMMNLSVPVPIECEIEERNWSCIFVPVWSVRRRTSNTNEFIYVNGQTGKVGRGTFSQHPSFLKIFILVSILFYVSAGFFIILSKFLQIIL